MDFTVFAHHTVRPLASLGFIHNFWGINLDTLIYTWCSIIFMCLTVFATKWFVIRHPEGRFANLCYMGVGYLRDMVVESLGRFDYTIFSFVAGIFSFTLFCNLLGIFPVLEESTNDVNTAFAIGLLSFLYVQYQGIKHKGWAYFSKYFKPFFIFLPLNIVSQLSKIASLTFRLFGNILAGAIVWSLLMMGVGKMWNKYLIFLLIFGILIVVYDKFRFLHHYRSIGKVMVLVTSLFYFFPAVQCFFGIFEGFTQAFVIALLTNMYISAEVSGSK